MSANWLQWTLAAAMIGVALFHAVRVATPHARPRTDGVDAEITHAAMGVAMTMMLLGVLAPSESRRVGLIFAVLLIWFVGHSVRSYIVDGRRAVGAPVRHVTGCAAMLYMLVVVSGAGPSAAPMAGMSTASSSLWPPMMAGTLVAATVAVALWTLARPGSVGLPAIPALAAGCQLAMNGATAYMLIAM